MAELRGPDADGLLYVASSGTERPGAMTVPAMSTVVQPQLARVDLMVIGSVPVLRSSVVAGTV